MTLPSWRPGMLALLLLAQTYLARLTHRIFNVALVAAVVLVVLDRVGAHRADRRAASTRPRPARRIGPRRGAVGYPRPRPPRAGRRGARAVRARQRRTPTSSDFAAAIKMLGIGSGPAGLLDEATDDRGAAWNLAPTCSGCEDRVRGLPARCTTASSRSSPRASFGDAVDLSVGTGTGLALADGITRDLDRQIAAGQRRFESAAARRPSARRGTRPSGSPLIALGCALLVLYGLWLQNPRVPMRLPMLFLLARCSPRGLRRDLRPRARRVAAGHAQQARRRRPGRRADAAAALRRSRRVSLRPPAHAARHRARCPRDSFMRTIQKRGRLIVGVDQNTLRFGYLDPFTGRARGLRDRPAARGRAGPARRPERDPDQGAHLGHRASTRCESVASTSSPRPRRSPARAGAWSRSPTPYYEAGQRLLVPHRRRSSGLRDLDGKKVCATVGSTSIENLRAAERRARFPYPVAQRTDCLVALQRGTVDAVTSDDAILLGFQAQDPYTKIVGPRFSKRAVRDGDRPLAPRVRPRSSTACSRACARTARGRSLNERWLGELAQQPPAARYRDEP